jgi:hypothetical protein
MRKKTKILMVIWVSFLLGGFVSISYYRQQQLQEQIEKNIAKLEEKIDEDSINLKKEFEALDKSNPVEISDHFGTELFSLYFVYFLDYHRYVQHMEKSFLKGTFQTQAYEYSLLKVHNLILHAYSLGTIKWECNTMEITSQNGEYCEMLSAYFTGKDQSFTWEEFIGSDDYAAFLNGIYSSLETRGEITFQQTYQQILDYKERTSSGDLYQDVLSESYVYLAQTAYRNYYMHKDQNDFVRAIMDAEIMYSVVSDYFDDLDKTSVASLVFSTPLSTGFVRIHNVILDIDFIFILSTCSVVVMWIVLNEFKKLD